MTLQSPKRNLDKEQWELFTKVFHLVSLLLTGSATFDGNPVALKVKHFRTQTEEFINEAKIRTLARHENVRKTHGVFIGDGGDPALMMGILCFL